MTFAEKLRDLRERAGLSQAELAKASGVPIWTLRKFEQGRREPVWVVLFQLADALSVPVEDFRECLGSMRKSTRKKVRSPPYGALAGAVDGQRKPRPPVNPNQPRPSYKASPLTRSKMGTFTSRCRLLCERCAAVLGYVDSTFRHTGMSAEKVISTWPEMRDPVLQHEERCRPKHGTRPA